MRTAQKLCILHDTSKYVNLRPRFFLSCNLASSATISCVDSADLAIAALGRRPHCVGPCGRDIWGYSAVVARAEFIRVQFNLLGYPFLHILNGSALKY